ARPLDLGYRGHKLAIREVSGIDGRMERIEPYGEPRARREHLILGAIRPLETQPQGGDGGMAGLRAARIARREAERFTAQRRLIFLALRTQGQRQLPV